MSSTQKLNQRDLRAIAKKHGLRTSLFALREADGNVGVWLQAIGIAKLDKKLKTILHRHVLMAKHGCKEQYIVHHSDLGSTSYTSLR